MSLTLVNHKKSLLLTGDTLPIKEKLKELKGNWNKPLSGWLFFPGTFDGIIDYVKKKGGNVNVKGESGKGEKKNEVKQVEVPKLLMKMMKSALSDLQEKVKQSHWLDLSNKLTSKLEEKLKSGKISKEEYESVKDGLSDCGLFDEKDDEKEDEKEEDE
jgi:hypothetical protein